MTPERRWKEITFKPHEVDGEEGPGLLIFLLYLDKLTQKIERG